MSTSLPQITVVTQTDASVYIIYSLPHVKQGMLKLDTLITLSVETDMETRPVLSLGIPFQSGYTTGSLLQAGAMAFPATVESPFEAYIEEVKKAEAQLGRTLRNRYLAGPSTWYGEEYLPPFSLLVVYTPEYSNVVEKVVNQKKIRQVQVAYMFIPGVRITQRTEEATPEGVTVQVYRYQQLGAFRYKTFATLVGNKQAGAEEAVFSIDNLLKFSPYQGYIELHNVIQQMLEKGAAAS